MKIYRLNDCDWYMAPSLEEAIQCAMDATGLPREEVVDGDERQLTDAELDTLMYWDEEALACEAGTVTYWQCSSCGENPKLNSRWQWNGRRWEHLHRRQGVDSLVPATNAHIRTFREELVRRIAAGAKSEQFASTEY